MWTLPNRCRIHRVEIECLEEQPLAAILACVPNHRCHRADQGPAGRRSERWATVTRIASRPPATVITVFRLLLK
jgi:hypothetical protein